MSGQKVVLNLDDICGSETNVGLRSCGEVFSSRVDMLASRADILNDKDRALMKMYLKNGMTFRQISQVAGTNEATIARRIRKLSSSLIDGEYITCLRNRNRFERIEMDVARDYYIEKNTQKQIAKKRRLTLHSTRRILHKIQRLVGDCNEKRNR